MVKVIVGEEETLNSALRRFQRSVSKAGIFADARKKQYFETPQEKRRRKQKARRRKSQRRAS